MTFSRGQRVRAICDCCPDVRGEVVGEGYYDTVFVRDDESGEEYQYAPRHLALIEEPRFLNANTATRTGALKP